MNDTWHAHPEHIVRYAAGTLDGTRAGSVEAHLVTCADCRAQVADAVKVPGLDAKCDRLEATWVGIIDTIDAPRPTVVERVIRRLGVRADTARILAATPSLHASWLLAVAVALGFASIAAQSGTERGLAVFLIVAPLVPVVGVAAAFGRDFDPTWEISAAAPGAGFRLLLLRTAAVLATAFPVAAAAAVALPGWSWTAGAWVLPALGLTLASLALSTYTSPERAAAAVSVTWVLVVLGSARETGNALTAFGPGGQLVVTLVAVAAVWLVAQRRDFFEIRSNL